MKLSLLPVQMGTADAYTNHPAAPTRALLPPLTLLLAHNICMTEMLLCPQGVPLVLHTSLCTWAPTLTDMQPAACVHLPAHSLLLKYLRAHQSFCSTRAQGQCKQHCDPLHAFILLIVHCAALAHPCHQLYIHILSHIHICFYSLFQHLQMCPSPSPAHTFLPVPPTPWFLSSCHLSHFPLPCSSPSLITFQLSFSCHEIALPRR